MGDIPLEIVASKREVGQAGPVHWPWGGALRVAFFCDARFYEVEQFDPGAIPLQVERFKLNGFQSQESRSLGPLDIERVELAEAQSLTVEAR